MSNCFINIKCYRCNTTKTQIQNSINSMASTTPSSLSCSTSIDTPTNESHFQSVSELYGDVKPKKIGKKKATGIKKMKSSPVKRAEDESSLQVGMINDNCIEDASNEQNSSPPDENLLSHLVLSKVLNRKKMQLLQSEEIRQAIAMKVSKKEKEK